MRVTADAGGIWAAVSQLRVRPNMLVVGLQRKHEEPPFHASLLFQKDLIKPVCVTVRGAQTASQDS